MLCYNVTAKLWSLLPYPSFHLHLFHYLSNQQQKTKYNEGSMFYVESCQTSCRLRRNNTCLERISTFFSKMNVFAFERHSSLMY